MPITDASFPPARPLGPDYRWKLYSVDPRLDEQSTALIAIGVREYRGPSGLVMDSFSYLINAKTVDPFMFMEGGASVSGGEVKVTPGGVFIDHSDLKGRGIGYLVMNEAVSWAKRNFPPITAVEPITIVRKNGISEKEWERTFCKLKQFYGRFGFVWPDAKDAKSSRSFPSFPTRLECLEVYEGDRLRLIKRIDLAAVLRSYYDLLQAESVSEKSDKDEIRRLKKWIREDQSLLKTKIGRRWLWLIPAAFISGYVIAFVVNR